MFDNEGNQYNVSKVLNSRAELDIAAYEAYSPAYFSATNALVYGAFFAIYTATISHVGCYHRKEIWNILKNFRKSMRDSEQDVHNRLMKAYKEGLSKIANNFIARLIICSARMVVRCDRRVGCASWHSLR